MTRSSPFSKMSTSGAHVPQAILRSGRHLLLQVHQIPEMIPSHECHDLTSFSLCLSASAFSIRSGWEPVKDATAAELDRETGKIVMGSYEKARRMLGERAEALTRVAEARLVSRPVSRSG